MGQSCNCYRPCPLVADGGDTVYRLAADQQRRIYQDEDVENGRRRLLPWKVFMNPWQLPRDECRPPTCWPCWASWDTVRAIQIQFVFWLPRLPPDGVAWSVCMCVCRSRSWALHKRLNRSRSRLGLTHVSPICHLLHDLTSSMSDHILNIVASSARLLCCIYQCPCSGYFSWMRHSSLVVYDDDALCKKQVNYDFDILLHAFCLNIVKFCYSFM